MLKKSIILFVSILLGFNISNLFNQPYSFIELNKGKQYGAEYEFISYKYDIVELYISSSLCPNQKQLIASYNLNSSINIKNLNLLDLSLLFEKSSGIIDVSINELTGYICVDIKDIHPRNYSLCTKNQFDINFLDYVISYQDDKNDDYVTLIKGTKKDKGVLDITEETFEIFVKFY